MSDMVEREATRRWKVCIHGAARTCPRADPDVPRVWCDACVARGLLDVLGQDAAPIQVRVKYPKMSAAQRRRREQERAEASR